MFGWIGQRAAQRPALGLALAAMMTAAMTGGVAAEQNAPAPAGAPAAPKNAAPAAPPAGTTGAPVGPAASKDGAVDAPREARVADQILDLRRKMKDAIARKDRAALEAMYHDRFTHLRETGRAETKKERIDLLLSGQNGVELASTDQALVETFSPDAAVLSGVSVIRDNRRKGKGDAFQWLTLYVRDKGVWRVALSQANRLPKPE
ncbi:nuclear transport factor 2 family protein [Camelimonas fluminis]|uniref:Nuclear transport factor 2 family protein n=1 Tax=Camelimonas fluminis TaxID=1576911 RepID=A0ABV7UNN0_9HYPH|nr:nuclear transport factor 2 family protein [Camelimonas fluminis]